MPSQNRGQVRFAWYWLEADRRFLSPAPNPGWASAQSVFRSVKGWEFGARRRPFRPESPSKADSEKTYGDSDTRRPVYVPPTRGIAPAPLIRLAPVRALGRFLGQRHSVSPVIVSHRHPATADLTPRAHCDAGGSALRSQKLGFRREARRYEPHLTIGRIRRRGPGVAELGELIGQHADYEAGRTAVSEVIVFSSQLDRSGPTYEALSRARLGGK
jgi:hypothetical protein